MIVGSLMLPAVGQAHSRLKPSPGIQPRNNNAGLKSGPCGQVPKQSAAPTLNAGEKIVVSWEETIDHPGRFEFRFSTDGDVTFSAPVTIQDTANGPTPHQYSVELTLPNVTCDNCTLQLIQVMTENPNNPSNYYSCADFKLVGGGAPASTPPPIPSNPSPSPGPETCDHEAQ